MQTSDLLLLHIAQTQYAQGMVQHHMAEGVQELLTRSNITVPPELAQAIGESKVKHDALKKALDAAQAAAPPTL